MNENIDLTKILMNCPKGFELYSPICGTVLILKVYTDDIVYPIRGIDYKGTCINFTKEGHYYDNCQDTECLLYPSKNQRDWSKFTAPWYNKVTQDDKYIIEKLYIMDVKTLSITKAIINKVDECKFAFYNFMDRECCYWLKGANIQNVRHSQGYEYPQFIVSKDEKSLYWLKDSFKWLVDDIGFILRDAWHKIYDEK